VATAGFVWRPDAMVTKGAGPAIEDVNSGRRRLFRRSIRPLAIIRSDTQPVVTASSGRPERLFLARSATDPRPAQRLDSVQLTAFSALATESAVHGCPTIRGGM
jgi:hypothetical protein